MPYIEFEKSVRDEDWSMLELHSHRHYEIYLLTKGNRSYFFDNAMYKISAPSLVIIPPNSVHKTEGSSFERHLISVSIDYLNAYERAVLDDKIFKVIKLKSTQIKSLNEVIEKAYELNKDDKFYALKIKALFSYLIFIIENLDAESEKADMKSENSIPPVFLKILDYINTNYEKDITLDLLAEKFFVPKTTILYNFKKFVGRSPIDFLLTVRISRAKKLLASSNKSMSEIAERCGFSSANYFGLIFKKKEKISPLTYRKIQREKE